MKNCDSKTMPALKKQPPRIVIKFMDNLVMPYTDDISEYLLNSKILPWKKLVDMFPGIIIKKLFTSVAPEEIKKMVLKASEKNSNYHAPEFLTYFTIDCPAEINEDKLLSELLKFKVVEYAYFESDTMAPPALGIRGMNVNLNKQGYLNAAPEGINAHYAWKVKGGFGENVNFIDIEQGWVLAHEDLKAAAVKLVWGKNTESFQEHGNNVLGVILMQDNAVGGVGIVPKVNASVISQINENGNSTIHDAVIKAIELLQTGDVLLLEAQVQDKSTGNKLWPPEIKPHIFHSIELAVQSGIIVIEPAGNGNDNISPSGNNLDDFAEWYGKNIFDSSLQNFKDSGAILVAAASSNEGYRKKKSSNFGSRIDCFAWGDNVYTTDDPNLVEIYADDFDATSAAAAIIAGAVISIQSINKQKGKNPLLPLEMRAILRDKTNGTPSWNKIGIMPDLQYIIENVI